MTEVAESTPAYPLLRRIDLPSNSFLGTEQCPNNKTDKGNTDVKSLGIISVHAVDECTIQWTDTEMLGASGTRDGRTGRFSCVFDGGLCSQSARQCAGIETHQKEASLGHCLISL